MAIHFACPRCTRRLSIATRKAGAEITCPACTQRVIVPDPPENKPMPGILIELVPGNLVSTSESLETDTPQLVKPPDPPQAERFEFEQTEPKLTREPEPVDDDDPLPIRRRKKKRLRWDFIFVGMLGFLALVFVIAAAAKVARNREAAKGTGSDPKQTAKSGGASRPAPMPPPEPAEERQPSRVELPRITEEDKRNASYGLKALAVVGGYIAFAVVSLNWVRSLSRKAKRNSESLVASGALHGAIAGMVIGCGVGIGMSQYWPVFTSAIPFELMAEPWSPVRIDGIPIHLLVFGIVGAILGGVGRGLTEASRKSDRDRRD